MSDLVTLLVVAIFAIVFCICNLFALILPYWKMNGHTSEGVLISCRSGPCGLSEWWYFALVPVGGQIMASIAVVLSCSGRNMQNNNRMKKQIVALLIGSGSGILANSLAVFLLPGEYFGISVYLSGLSGMGLLVLGILQCLLIAFHKTSPENIARRAGHCIAVVD